MTEALNQSALFADLETAPRRLSRAAPPIHRVMEDAATMDNEEALAALLSLHVRSAQLGPLVERLLARFGDMLAVINADAPALLSVPGMAPTAVSAIKVSQSIAVRLMRGRIDTRKTLGSWQALIDYLMADMGSASHERVRCLYLNAKNQLIRDEIVSDGTVDEAACYVRNIIRRALDLGATAMILVHNHPSGDPAPSQADITLTRTIAAAGRPLNIAVHDHVIVGNGKHSSMRGMGLI